MYMKYRSKRSIVVLALCIAVCMVSSACSMLVNADAVRFSDDTLLDFLHEMVSTGQTEGGILIESSIGDNLSPVIDDAVRRLHSTDYALYRFVSMMNWTVQRRIGGVRLDVKLEYTVDFSVKRLHDVCPGMVLPKYDGTELLNRVEDAVLAQEAYVRCAYLYDDILESRIGGLVDGMYDRSGICGYYVAESSYTAQQYGDGLEVVITLEYEPDTIPYDELPTAQTEYEALDCILDAWEDGEDIAVFRAQESSWTYDDLFDMCNTAEANFATNPCESDYMHCSMYPRNGIDRIAEVWLTCGLDDETYAQYEAELQRMLDKYIVQLQEQNASDDRELYLAAHDLVLKLCKYDNVLADATLDGTLTAEQNALRTAYGVFVKGRSVCTGYARAYKALCDGLGIPCWVVYGEQDGGGHAWNMVRLDDQLLYVDCTFDDTGGGHEYFLMDRDEMMDNDYIVDEGFIMPPLR